MRAVPRRALAAAPAAVLMFALVACGGGSDSGDSAARASDKQAAQGAAPAEDEAAEAQGGDEVETPLTGEAKQKAEAAALAAYPGTVVKSEEDAENPGMYAVEIKKADGSEVEVYLDPKSYKVVKAKDEEGDEEGS